MAIALAGIILKTALCTSLGINAAAICAQNPTHPYSRSAVEFCGASAEFEAAAVLIAVVFSAVGFISRRVEYAMATALILSLTMIGLVLFALH